MTQLPDFEAISSAVTNIATEDGKYKNISITFDMFLQTWPDTAGGFSEPGMMAGQGFTDEYTTVAKCQRYNNISEPPQIIYAIFFGNHGAYTITNPSEKFFSDLKERRLLGKYEALTKNIYTVDD